MITITRLNGQDIIVHAAQIESLEGGVDTRVTLLNGKQLFVRQSVEEVCSAVRQWYRSVAHPSAADSWSSSPMASRQTDDKNPVLASTIDERQELR